MTSLEKTFFELYFIINSKGLKVDKKNMDLVLNILLNSKELVDTDLKFTNGVHNSRLIGLVVNVMSNVSYEISMMYSIQSEEIIENRVATGTMTISLGKVYSDIYINRLGINDDKTYELLELFEISSRKDIKRFSTYSLINTYSFDFLNYYKFFDKATNFKEEFCRSLKLK